MKREFKYEPGLGGWFDQQGVSPPTADAILLLKSEQEDLDHSDDFVIMGLGYIAAKVPALHRAKPRTLLDAWIEFKKEMGK